MTVDDDTAAVAGGELDVGGDATAAGEASPGAPPGGARLSDMLAATDQADPATAAADAAAAAGGADPAEKEEAAADDWRAAASGGDERLLKELKRYASPNDVVKALVEAKDRIRTGFKPPELPKNATPEQLAAYRKAIGVPEAPDGYGVAFSEALRGDESLNQSLNDYLAFAHERNIPPAAVKAAVEWFEADVLRKRAEVAAAAARERARITQVLKETYSGDYERNVTLTNEFLTRYPGLGTLINPDAPNLELARDLVSLALATAPESALYAGDSASGGKSLEAQIAELTQKSINGTLTDEEDVQYNRLLEIREERNSRRRQRAA